MSSANLTVGLASFALVLAACGSNDIETEAAGTQSDESPPPGYSCVDVDGNYADDVYGISLADQACGGVRDLNGDGFVDEVDYQIAEELGWDYQPDVIEGETGDPTATSEPTAEPLPEPEPAVSVSCPEKYAASSEPVSDEDWLEYVDPPAQYQSGGSTNDLFWGQITGVTGDSPESADLIALLASNSPDGPFTVPVIVGDFPGEVLGQSDIGRVLQVEGQLAQGKPTVGKEWAGWPAGYTEYALMNPGGDLQLCE